MIWFGRVQLNFLKNSYIFYISFIFIIKLIVSRLINLSYII